MRDRSMISRTLNFPGIQIIQIGINRNPPVLRLLKLCFMGIPGRIARM